MCSIEDAAPVLGELVDGLRETIPDRLVGVYVQGSFVLGELDEHSDLDFVVAIDGALDDADLERIGRMHGRIFDLPLGWARHLDGSYVPVGVLRNCDRRGEDLWYLDNGARSLVASAHCNTAVVRHLLREHGVVLTGPDPRDLIDRVPTSLLREEIAATMRDWGREILEEPDRYANRFYQGFIVLSYCRMWCDLVLGDVGSKRRGAEWTKQRLDASWQDLIDRAWATRRDPARSVRTPSDPADSLRTLSFVRLVLERSGVSGTSSAPSDT